MYIPYKKGKLNIYSSGYSLWWKPLLGAGALIDPFPEKRGRERRKLRKNTKCRISPLGHMWEILSFASVFFERVKELLFVYGFFPPSIPKATNKNESEASRRCHENIRIPRRFPNLIIPLILTFCSGLCHCCYPGI